MEMITKRVTTSDGIVREFVGKIWDEELRVYKIYGDVTNIESLKEAAQILAIECHVSNILYTNL